MTATQRPSARVGETRNGAASFVGKLDAGELLTGIPTVEEVGSTDLTITDESVSSSDLTINGKTVPAGQAVQFSASGFVADTDYDLKITADTNAMPAQTLVMPIKIKRAD